MRLEEYIEEFGISPPKLAKKANVSALTIRNIMQGKKDIQLSTALKIEAATKGQVTCREMLPKILLEQMLKAPSQSKGQGDSKKPPKEFKGIARWATPEEIKEDDIRMERLIERAILEKSLKAKNSDKKKHNKKKL